MKKIIFFFVLYTLISGLIKSQPSEGGKPFSFKHPDQSVKCGNEILQKPNMQLITQQDEFEEGKGVLKKVATKVYANFNLNNSGIWTELPNGDRIWKLKITIPDALGLTVLYDNFWIPAGARLFLYNENKKQVIGAFTENNNSSNGSFATELIQGESVTLEYYEPSRTMGFSIINISGLLYLYRDAGLLSKYGDNQYKEFGDAGACEVNINCPEGDNWQDQKKGVARVMIVEGASGGWCSGTLLNNVLQDCKPYFLLADHCAHSCTPSDLNQWVFYFNYEATACTNPSTEPTGNTINGCTKRAQGGNEGSTGSDFYFVELNSAPTFNPYYNGWDRSTTGSTSGVSIHHPAGDIKKISTYTQQLTSTDYNGSGVQSHWRVYWAATVTNHGVTEGGSSGSPIFNSSKLVVGDLTGGSSYCSALTSPDAYGKFSWSWDQNGSTAADRLKDWLDPNNTNVMSLTGMYCGGGSINADFSGTPTTIPVAGTVTFTDLSTGGPTGWSWSVTPNTGVTYVGGTSSSSQNPQMQFANAGLYTISLTITKATDTDTETKNNYITVGDVPPVADFVGNPLSVLVGGTVNFTDLSAGAPTSWQWTFDGGSPGTSTTQNPTNITYSTAGDYTVKLKVSNATGSDSITKVNYIHVGNTPPPDKPCDTGLMPFPGTPVLYSINYANHVKGYISGTNGYSDKVKANFYVASAPYSKLYGALFKFGFAKRLSTANSNVIFAIWDNTGPSGKPGTIIATDTLLLSDVIACTISHKYVFVDFSSHPVISSGYYLGVYIPNAIGDSLALLTNKNNETFPGIAWEQWRNDSWYNYADSSSWKKNVGHVIHPIMCRADMNVEQYEKDDEFIIYPNPASTSLNIAFLSTPKEFLRISLYNLMGQKVASYNFEGYSKDALNIDISNCRNGIYILNIESKDKFVSKKISILK